MPTYDYLCQRCGEAFEIRLSMAEYSARRSVSCPHCGSDRVVRTFTPLNLLTGSRGRGGIPPGCDPSAGPGCCG